MGDGEGKEKEAETKKIVHTYPLIRVSHNLLIDSLLHAIILAFRHARRN